MIAFALILACLPSALMDFAIPKWNADSNVRIEDAYKWVYQATRGGEHAVPDTESASKWLAGEWASLGTGRPKETLWEPLCPGGEIGRLNLRPFRDRGGKAVDLLGAFLSSSREYRTDGANFIAAWKKLGKRLKHKSLVGIDFKAWSKLDGEMKAKNYPAIHHSEAYEKANLPAYRILTLAQKKKLLGKKDD